MLQRLESSPSAKGGRRAYDPSPPICRATDGRLPGCIMTPHDFVATWRNNTLTERAASQSHFRDLCALLGLLDPKAADPAGEWFAFNGRATFDLQATMLSRRL